MNRNQFIFLIVLVAIVGGAGLFLSKKKNDSWSDPGARLGQNVLPDFPINDVAQVTITSPSGSLGLIRKDDGWVVEQRGGYPANFGQIRDFVQKAWELKVAQPKFVTEAQLDRFDLLLPDKGANAGTLVDFKDKDGKSIERLRVGKQHMRESSGDSGFGGSFPDGRYVMVGDDLDTVALVKDPLNDVETDPQRWLDKDFFKVDGVRTVTVQAQDATNSWKLTRESRTADWQLVDPQPGEVLEKSKVTSVSSVLSSPSFTDVVPDATPEASGLQTPRTATLETFDDFTYVVTLGTTNDSGNYHMKVSVSADLPAAREPGENETEEDKPKLDAEWKEKNDKLKEKLAKESRLAPWTYLMSKWTIDPLLKQRHELLSTNAPAEVPFSPLVEPPAKVTSEPVRVPPVEEPIIPDPTQPPPVVPEPVNPPPLPPLPDVPPPPAEKAPDQPEKAPADAPPAEAPPKEEKAPEESGPPPSP